jgi:DNA-directed RNA polymerase specialized sigma subunit
MHSGTDNLQSVPGEGTGPIGGSDGGDVKKKKKKPSNYFIDPQELKEEIIKSKEQNELTKRAVEMLTLMATEASKKLKYRDEEDRKDCIAFALMDVVRYWRSFNPEKSNNPFAYFTQMIKNGFAKGWRKLHPIASGNKVSLSHDNVYTI